MAMKKAKVGVHWIMLYSKVKMRRPLPDALLASSTRRFGSGCLREQKSLAREKKEEVEDW